MEARQVGGVGRIAQRRRTRAAIVEAATRLIAAGANPSVDDIAAEADVSRRTVYMYFPTLDQLLLDATLGALSAATVDAALGTDTSPDAGGSAAVGSAAGGSAAARSDDAAVRVDALVRALTSMAPTTLPLGRKIIQLTVERPAPADGTADPRRGFRRVGWIERAVEPLRGTVSAEQLDRLVAALAVLLGWEAMIVLRDVCGLTPEREEEVLRWAAASLVQSVVAEPGRAHEATVESSPRGGSAPS